MKKQRRIVKKIMEIIILISLIQIPLFSVYATTADIIGKADGFIKQGKEENELASADVISSLIPVGQILVGVGGTVVVVVGLVLAIKYMRSGADEKANVKEKLVWYFIAIILIFGAVGITGTLVKVLTGVLG